MCGILVILFSCNKSGKKYVGYYDETAWQYEINEDNMSYKFQAHGHFCNCVSTGYYTSKGDTIYLKSNPSDSSKHMEFEFLNMNNWKLLKDGDSCIIQVEANYKMCTNTKVYF